MSPLLYGLSEDECDAPVGYMLQAMFEQKEAAYLAAQAAYGEIDASGVTIDCDATIVADGEVVIWTSDAAREIVRRVDKRSVLQ